MVDSLDTIHVTIVSLAGNVLLDVDAASNTQIKELELQVEEALPLEMQPLRALVLESSMLDGDETLEMQVVSGSVLQAVTGLSASFQFFEQYQSLGECLQIHVVVAPGSMCDLEEVRSNVSHWVDVAVHPFLSEADGQHLQEFLRAEEGHGAFCDVHGHEPSYETALKSRPRESACLKRMIARARTISYFDYACESQLSYLLGAEFLVDGCMRISTCFHAWEWI